jgi:hypothetical protein
MKVVALVGCHPNRFIVAMIAVAGPLTLLHMLFSFS